MRGIQNSIEILRDTGRSVLEGRVHKTQRVTAGKRRYGNHWGDGVGCATLWLYKKPSKGIKAKGEL